MWRSNTWWTVYLGYLGILWWWWIVAESPINIDKYVILGGGNSSIFYFHPENWGNDPFWRAYFSKGLVQPPPRILGGGNKNMFFWKLSFLGIPILMSIACVWVDLRLGFWMIHPFFVGLLVSNPRMADPFEPFCKESVWYVVGSEYSITLKVLYIPGGCLGFLNHQQYHESERFQTNMSKQDASDDFYSNTKKDSKNY